MQTLVYTVRDHPACRATTRQLTLDHIWYRSIDITDDENSREILRIHFGYQGEPSLVVASEGMRVLDHWTGHQPDRIQNLAGQYWGTGDLDTLPEPGPVPPGPRL